VRENSNISPLLAYERRIQWQKTQKKDTRHEEEKSAAHSGSSTAAFATIQATMQKSGPAKHTHTHTNAQTHTQPATCRRKIGEHLAKLQARTRLSLHLRAGPTHCKNEESARNKHVLACNFAKCSPSFKMFSLAHSAINLS